MREHHGFGVLKSLTGYHLGDGDVSKRTIDLVRQVHVATFSNDR